MAWARGGGSLARAEAGSRQEEKRKGSGPLRSRISRASRMGCPERESGERRLGPNRLSCGPGRRAPGRGCGEVAAPSCPRWGAGPGGDEAGVSTRPPLSGSLSPGSGGAPTAPPSPPWKAFEGRAHGLFCSVSPGMRVASSASGSGKRSDPDLPCLALTPWAAPSILHLPSAMHSAAPRCSKPRLCAP